MRVGVGVSASESEIAYENEGGSECESVRVRMYKSESRVGMRV